MKERDSTMNKQHPDYREGKDTGKIYEPPSVETESLLALEAFGGCSLTSDDIVCVRGGSPSSA